MQNALFMWLELLVIGVLFLAGLIYSIRACVTDARRRGQSPILVAALVILFFPVGSLIWLLARPPIVEDPKGPRPFRLDDFRRQ
jgi:hypothetical protein